MVGLFSFFKWEAFETHKFHTSCYGNSLTWIDCKRAFKKSSAQKSNAHVRFKSQSMSIVFSRNQKYLSVCSKCSGIVNDFLISSGSERTVADCCRHQCIWSCFHHYSGFGLKDVLLNHLSSAAPLWNLGLQSTKNLYGEKEVETYRMITTFDYYISVRGETKGKGKIERKELAVSCVPSSAHTVALGSLSPWLSSGALVSFFIIRKYSLICSEKPAPCWHCNPLPHSRL